MVINSQLEKKITEKLDRWEGGYVNDPNDPGGETFFGITRKNYPDKPWWSEVDQIKSMRLNKQTFNAKMKELAEKYWMDRLDVQRKYYTIVANLPDNVPDDIVVGLVCFSYNTGVKLIAGISVQQDIAGYVKRRVCSYYSQLLIRKPNLNCYRKGWLNRVRDTFNDNKLMFKE